MGWPKLIMVRGVQVPVESWEEFDELVGRYGGDALVLAPASSQDGNQPPRPRGGGGSSLTPPDRALLQGFVDGGNRGLLITAITQATGARGKGIRPALERWSRRVGLVTEDKASAFEPVKRSDGRAYRLTGVHTTTAKAMLGS